MRIHCTDCEGEITKNDNAQELCNYYIPGGDEWFAKISKYDDFLADIMRKPGYKAGDTLRLILPFLSAYGATNEGIQAYSAANILLVPGAREMLNYVQGIMPSYIISTSYEPYVRSLCDIIGFPFGNAYCTRLDINGYLQDEEEVSRLKDFKQKIDKTPLLEWPDKARLCGDLSLEMQKTAMYLDYIFWEKISEMKISGAMLKGVNPIGGIEKANALQDIAKREGVELSDLIYFGDSITDTEALKLVRENGGVAVSFNGNKYAVEEAQIAVLSFDAAIIGFLADSFRQLGKDDLLIMAKRWATDQIAKRVILLTNDNREQVAKESSAFRKTVRGEEVGRLG